MLQRCKSHRFSRFIFFFSPINSLNLYMNIVLNIKEVSTLCRVIDCAHKHMHKLSQTKFLEKCEPKYSWEMMKIERKKNEEKMPHKSA